MAERRDVLVPIEHAFIDKFEKNKNFYGVSPMSFYTFPNFAPSDGVIYKFNVPEEIKKRRIKEITGSLKYKINSFLENSVIFDQSAIGMYQGDEDRYSGYPETIDLKSITFSSYKDDFFSLAGDTIYGLGGFVGSYWVTKGIAPESGVTTSNIWSTDSYNVDDITTKFAIDNFFKYGCYIISVKSAWAELYSDSLSITFVTEDPVGSFEISAKSPSAGSFVNRKKETKISWSLGNVAYVFSPTVQKTATVRWKEKGTDLWNEVSVDAETSLIIPENTFPKNRIVWQVVSTSDSGLVSTSQEFEFTTVDYLSTPKAIYPKSIIVDNNKDNVFEWEHIVGTGTEQTKAELEYKEQDKDWTTFAIVEGNAEKVVIKSGTLPTGKLMWRVRTYNMDGVAGDWSKEEEIVSRGSSPAPDPVTANTSPRVLVEWQSEGQISAEVRIRGIVYKVYGNAKKFKCPVYLSDGEALVEVRVLNEFDLWSEWGSTITIIKNADIPRIEANYTVENYGVSMTWNTSGVSSYIYRDGVLIAKTTSNEYIDYESVGQHEYYIMVGNTEGYYAYSEPFIVDVKVPFALLSKRYTGEWIVLDKKRGDFPSHKIDSKVNTTYQFYAGRKLPVAYQSDNLTRVHSLDFSFRKRGSSEKVAALSGEEVVYKDCRGDIAVGVMDKVTQDTDTGTDIKFQITEISDGEISYD